MDVSELVRSILDGDLLTARQWVDDARRVQLVWDEIPEPQAMNEQELAVAAALVELLAGRSGCEPPSWTARIGAVQDPMVLDPGLEAMPRSFARAKQLGPAPLRRRNLIASPDFLDVA